MTAKTSGKYSSTQKSQNFENHRFVTAVEGSKILNVQPFFHRSVAGYLPGEITCKSGFLAAGLSASDLGASRIPRTQSRISGFITIYGAFINESS